MSSRQGTIRHVANTIPFESPGQDPEHHDPAGRGRPAVARGFGGQEDDESALNLKALFEVLLRRKVLIAAVVVFITAVAAVYVNQLTPLYSADADIIVESGKQNVVDIDSVAQGLSNDYYTQETQAAVLSSRELAAQIVDRLNLTEHPLFTGEDEPESAFRAVIGTVKTWLKGVSDAVVDAILPAPDVLNGDRLDIDDEPSEAEVAAEEAEWREDVIDYFLSGLEITPSERSRVITIEYISTDPEFAALAANTLAEVYILDQLNRKTDVTRQATAWLDTRVEDLRQRLVETKRRLEEFRRDSGYVEVAGTSVLQTQLAELSADLSKARTARAEAEARASQVGELMESEGGLETAAAVLDSTLIQRLREQEAQVARKIAELRTQLRDGHPKLDLATNELKELRDSIQTEVVKIARNLENEAELARVREANIENELERLRVRIDQQSEAEVTIRALETEVEANERLYETMLTRLKETRIQDESLQQADARIISRAVVPGRPYFPNKRGLVLLAFIVSLGVGVFGAFVVEYLDAGFRSVSQVETVLGLPVIGVLPAVGTSSRRRGTAKMPHEIAVERPNSVFGEAVRSLRTGLMLSNVDKAPKSVVVSSAVPREGKSSVSLSLACSAAKAGQRAIIVDCDLRSPSVHEYLGLPNERGLTDYLLGEVTLDDVLEFDTKSGVHILTAGAHAPNPADMLGSMHMTSLIHQFTRNYDLVVLDSPPLLAVSDTLILARLADKVVFCVRWAKTRRDSSVVAARQLIEAGADMAGVVLTQVDAHQHASYDHGRTSHYFDSYHKYYAD